MKLINYSHPLSPKAAEELRRFYDFTEHRIECQIDFDAPEGIEAQLHRLAMEGVKLAGDSVQVLYIPPALSFAAAYVTAQLRNVVELNIVVLKAAPGPVREYVLAEVVEL